MQQLQEAERRFGPIGVAGVYGVGKAIAADDPGQPLGAERIGGVNDRGRVLRGGPGCPHGWRRSTRSCWSCVEIRACDSIRSLVFIFTVPISATKRATKGWPWWHWPHRAITIRAVSDCRRRFKRARRFSPANGATCCRWPRRASSSTREVRFTCRAMPWIAWDRLLSQSSVFGGRRRQPRTKVPRPSWGIVLTPDAGGPSPHPNYALACMVTRAHVRQHHGHDRHDHVP